MIRSTTVFVLGAGANCSYGFPSGEKLKQEIVETVRKSISGNDDTSFFHLSGIGLGQHQAFQPSACSEFSDALKKSGQPSIDAFLNANRHKEGYLEIGKGAIAQVLLEYEAKSTFESSDDWLSYIFNIMLDGVWDAEQFIDGNRVGFITFNYDRFLESWLHTKIQYSFGIEEEAAMKILERIPILHVYGMLGPFSPVGKDGPRAWVAASSGIKTIFDAEYESRVLASAKNLLSNAHVICLLGFGFHRENIGLLNLGVNALKCSGKVCCSRFDIFDQEWERLTRPFSGAKLIPADYTKKCLGAIRNLPIF